MLEAHVRGRAGTQAQPARSRFLERRPARRLAAVVLGVGALVGLAAPVAGAVGSAPGAPPPAAVVIAATVGISLTTPVSVTAGAAGQVITATVRDAGGDAVADGVTVTFASSLGSVTPDESATVGGVVTSTFVPGPTAGAASVSAQALEASAETVVLVAPGPPAHATWLIPPVSPVAGASMPLAARITDAFDNKVLDGTRVGWTVQRGGVTPTSSSTLGGVARTTFSDTSAGDNSVRAASGAAVLETGFTVLPGPAASLEVEAIPNRIAIDGGQAQLVATAVDRFGNRTADALQVQLSAGGGNVSPGTVTLRDGRASATYTAAGEPGEFTLAATSGSLAASTTIALRPADVALEIGVVGAGGASSDQIHPGDHVELRIVLNNGDLATAKSPVLGIVLPDAFQRGTVQSSHQIFLRSSGPPGLLPDPPPGHSALYWDLPNLAYGQVVTISIPCVVRRDAVWSGFDTLYFQAAVVHASREQSYGDLQRSRLIEVHAADLAVDVRLDDGQSVLRPGGRAVYDITAANNQASTIVTGLRITDTLPVGTTLDHWEPGSGADALQEVPPFDPATGSVAWVLPTELRAGASLKLWLAINADTPPEAVIDNVVAVGSPVLDVEPDNNSRSRAVVLRGVNLAATVSGPAQAAPGDEVTYEVAVTNLSQRDGSTAVKVVSNPPRGARLVRRTDGGVVGPAGDITWEVPGIGPGGTATFEVVIEVPEATPVGALLHHAASATSKEPDSYPDDNTGEHTLRVVPGRPSVVSVGQVDPAEACGAATLLEATIRDRFGNPVSDGTTVKWTTDLGRILDAQSTTRGRASATFDPGRAAGTAHVAATANGATGGGTVAVVAGLLRALAVTAQPQIVAAGGRVTVTANGLDACAKPAANGTLVALSAERGQFTGGLSTTSLALQGGKVSTTLAVGGTTGPLRVAGRFDDVLGEAVVSVVRPEDVPTPTPRPGGRVWLPIVVARR